jgi:hypothetical protein
MGYEPSIADEVVSLLGTNVVYTRVMVIQWNGCEVFSVLVVGWFGWVN